MCLQLVRFFVVFCLCFYLWSKFEIVRIFPIFILNIFFNTTDRGYMQKMMQKRCKNEPVVPIVF